MGETDSILRRAKELFSDGSYEEAEVLLRKLDDSDPPVLNFRAYLLYKQGRHEDAAEAYSRLTEIDAGDCSHLMNLGLISFKLNRFGKARDAFEKVQALRPGDKRTLRNLGYCCRRLGDHRQAERYFRLAGEAAAGEDARANGGEIAGDGDESDGTDRRNFTSWIKAASRPSSEQREDALTSGPGEVFLQLDEKIYLSIRHLMSYRGVIVFSPMSREARKSAARFGDRGSEIVRVEGTGELGISGGGSTLYTFHLTEGELVRVNYSALVLHDDGIEATPSFDVIHRRVFMAVGLRGEGRIMIAMREPTVLYVPKDYPVVVRPSSVVAWAGSFAVETEQSPVGGWAFGRKEDNRYLRFEGDGYLLIQGSRGVS